MLKSDNQSQESHMKEQEKEIQDLKEKVSELKNDNQTQESHMKEQEKLI